MDLLRPLRDGRVIPKNERRQDVLARHEDLPHFLAQRVPQLRGQPRADLLWRARPKPWRAGRPKRGPVFGMSASCDPPRAWPAPDAIHSELILQAQAAAHQSSSYDPWAASRWQASQFALSGPPTSAPPGRGSRAHASPDPAPALGRQEAKLEGHVALAALRSSPVSAEPGEDQLAIDRPALRSKASVARSLARSRAISSRNTTFAVRCAATASRSLGDHLALLHEHAPQAIQVRQHCGSTAPSSLQGSRHRTGRDSTIAARTVGTSMVCF